MNFRIDQELRARLEKQVPVLRMEIRAIFEKFDKEFGLSGASVPVTFGFDEDLLGAYTPKGGDEDEHFHFSLLFVGSYAERTLHKADRLDIFKHEYAHFMQYNMNIPEEHTWKPGKHGSAWKYCCSLVGAAPTEFYKAGEGLMQHDYAKALKNPWKDPNTALLDTVRREKDLKREKSGIERFRLGETVKHPRFGEGVVEDLEHTASGVRVVMRFKDGVRKIDQTFLFKSTLRKADSK